MQQTVEFPINTASNIQEDSTVVSMVNQGLRAAIMPRLAAVPIPQNVQVYSLLVPLERIIPDNSIVLLKPCKNKSFLNYSFKYENIMLV
ncbi:MAG: hypothetical protein RMY34_29600 [Aulosira sp. DedQUE10]|nr:hypothetical protein [Aulosira sp. DedQUE10]